MQAQVHIHCPLTMLPFYRKARRVSLIFAALSKTQHSSALIPLADIEPRENARIENTFFSGTILVVCEMKNRSNSFIRAFDLSHGITYLVHVKFQIRAVNIVDSSYLLVAFHSGLVYGTQLNRFKSDNELIPFRMGRRASWLVASIPPLTSSTPIFISHSSTRDLPEKLIYPGVTENRETIITCHIWYGTDKNLFLVKGTMPRPWVLVPEDNLLSRSGQFDVLLTSRSSPLPSHFSAPFHAMHIPYFTTESILHRIPLLRNLVATGIQVPSAGSELPPGSNIPARPPVLAYKIVFGDRQVLSYIACPRDRLKGLVISGLTRIGAKEIIEHRPLFFRDHKGITGPLPSEKVSDPLFQLSTTWSEAGGRVAILTGNIEEGRQVYRIQIYQL
ncbi:hypothetical protein DL93DRAFT_1598443 [Clavulina sp. PMI_390]|nr:hypothetical protein DL93DRAFT_1598443 [Clavulina sp. PMI_390]